jgi:hypothetical protein
VRVTGVSSPTDDYLPLISPDGEIMFFTRTVSKQAKGDVAPRTYEHFSWCKRPDINTRFDEGAALPEPFNQGANCGGATITVDNRELIVAMKNPNPKNPDNIDLFRRVILSARTMQARKFTNGVHSKAWGTSSIPPTVLKASPR